MGFGCSAAATAGSSACRQPGSRHRAQPRVLPATRPNSWPTVPSMPGSTSRQAPAGPGGPNAVPSGSTAAAGAGADPATRCGARAAACRSRAPAWGEVAAVSLQGRLPSRQSACTLHASQACACRALKGTSLGCGDKAADGVAGSVRARLAPQRAAAEVPASDLLSTCASNRRSNADALFSADGQLPMAWTDGVDGSTDATPGASAGTGPYARPLRHSPHHEEGAFAAGEGACSRRPPLLA